MTTATTTLPKTKHKTLRHLLEAQARDLFNAETKYEEFLGRMVISSKDADLESKFGRVRDAVSNNIASLRSICDRLGVPPTGVKCEAMAGLLREAQDSEEEYAHGSLRDAALIANAQRIAHYEIAGFGTAKAFAEKLNLDDIAKEFEEMAEQAGDIDKKFTKIATGSWLSTGLNDEAV